MKERRKEIAAQLALIDEHKTILERLLEPPMISKLYVEVGTSAENLKDYSRKRLEDKFNRLVCSRSWEFVNSRYRNRGQGLPRAELDKILLNSSSRTVTGGEKKVLVKGLNFVPTPPTVDYLGLISRVEHGIRNEDPLKANEIRCSVANCLVTRRYQPMMNFTAEEAGILKDLKQDHSVLITKADKGNVVVIMDTEAYEDKVKELLKPVTYVPLERDPTADVRIRLIGLLKSFYDETKENSLSDMTKRLRFASGFTRPELFGLPKIHKENIPLRPVVGCGSTITSDLSKYLSKILKPLTGLRHSHIANSLEFRQEIKQVTVDADDILVSYDLKDLFTSVPLDITFAVIQERLSTDLTLVERTRLNPFYVKELVKFCLNEGNYFHWKGSFFSQKNGAPMGSSLSPTVADIFMEHLEEKAFPAGISDHGLKMFKRYVDNIFVIIKKGREKTLLDHLNGLFPNVISFTMEKEEKGELPFLDVLVVKGGSHLRTRVYRKPTHSDRYLNFHSNHPMNVKMGIATGMVDRAVKICDEEFLEDELNHIRRTLIRNDYPTNLVENCIKARVEKIKSGVTVNSRKEPPGTKVIIPYYPGLGEEVKRIGRRLGLLVVFNDQRNLRAILRSDKVKIPLGEKPGLIYQIKCRCGATYIGETGHMVKQRFEQHKTALNRYRVAEERQRGEERPRRGRPQNQDPQLVKEEAIRASALVEHVTSMNCPEASVTVSTVRFERNFKLRKIEEAFYIKHNRCLNRDEGVGVSDVWSTVVNKTNCCDMANSHPGC